MANAGSLSAGFTWFMFAFSTFFAGLVHANLRKPPLLPGCRFEKLSIDFLKY